MSLNIKKMENGYQVKFLCGMTLMCITGSKSKCIAFVKEHRPDLVVTVNSLIGME